MKDEIKEFKTFVKSGAFPQKYDIEGSHPIYNLGLTKREYFAAMALQALLSKPIDDITQTAKESVIAADFLIKELNK